MTKYCLIIIILLSNVSASQMSGDITPLSEEGSNPGDVRPGSWPQFPNSSEGLKIIQVPSLPGHVKKPSALSEAAVSKGDPES